MKIPSIDTRRIWLTLSTMLAVGLMFSWYFLLHVPGKEDDIVDKKYRALRRVGQNLVQMREDCENAINQELASCDEVFFQYLDAETNYYENRTAANLKNFNKLQRQTDSCQREANKSLDATLEKLKVRMAYDYTGTSKPSDDYEYVYFMNQAYKMHLDSFINNTALINEYFDRFVIVRLYRERGTKDTTIQRMAYQGTEYNKKPGRYSRISLDDLKPVVDKPGITSTTNVAGTEYRVFSHVISAQKDEEWVLCGLESEKDIRRESRSIQPITIVFLVLAFLFLLLAMPVLKLIVMSSIERLDSSNVFYLGLSLIVGTAVAFLILLVSHHFITYQAGYEKELRSISSQIDQNFKAEIQDITKQLENFSAHDWVLDRGKTYMMDARGLTSYDSQTYPFYNEAIALNHNGDACITLATHPLSDLSTVPNIGSREYFKGANAGKRPYVVQSILSRNTLRHEAGIGVPAKKALYVTTPQQDATIQRLDTITVLAIATKLKSVMDPLLPPAYSFCMIDEDGEVRFHSNKLRNLQENLFEETENDPLLKAAVKGRLAIDMSLSYGGKDYRAFVRPVSGQPLHLVALFDKEYYHVPVILTMSVALLLIFVHFAFQGLQLLLLYITTYRSSTLKLQQFFLYWGRPRLHEPDIATTSSLEAPVGWKEKLVQMSFRERYNAGLCSMAMIAIGMVIPPSLLDNVPVAFILAFMTIPIHLTAFHYLVLTHGQREKNRRKDLSVISSGTIVLIILAIGLSCLNTGEFLVLLTTQAFILGVFWLNLFNNNVKKIHRIFSFITPTHRYALFVFGWLVMISVFPISFYYKVAFDRETKAFERYVQWESNVLIAKRNQLLEDEARQLWTINRKLGLDPGELTTCYIDIANRYGSYLPIKSDFDTGTLPELPTTPLDSIEFSYRPLVSGQIENSRTTLLGNVHDRPIKWFVQGTRTLLLESNDKSVKMATVVPGFSLLAAKYFVVVVIILAIMFAAIYKIILSGMKYIFGIGRLSGARPAEVEAKKILDALLQPDSKFRVFLIGLPFSGKTGLAKQIQKQLEEGDPNDSTTKAGMALLTRKRELDFRHYEKDLKLTGNEKLFILKHFEHELNDHARNEDKLSVLEELQRHDEIKIMISSAVEPDLIIEIYEKKIARLEAEKSEKSDDTIRTQLASCRTAYRKWKNLLGGFKVLHLPIKSVSAGNALQNELGYGTYLPRLINYFGNDHELTEDKILEIAEMASPYYHALWNSFSQHEKRVLFDLAKDGFVNLRDITKIRLLIKKGIVVMEDCPRIMNKSFTNFILSVVKEDEELAMNEEVRRKGTWHAVQLVLVITLVSIIVFVAFVQREMIPNLNVTIGAISGLIALLGGFQRMLQSKS